VSKIFSEKDISHGAQKVQSYCQNFYSLTMIRKCPYALHCFRIHCQCIVHCSHHRL